MKNIYPKHINLIPVVALIAGALFAFRQPENSAGNIRVQNQVLSGIRNSKANDASDTLGRPVRIDSAQNCIDRFAGYMKLHGFSDVAGQPIDLHITETSMITSGQTFDGKPLLDWLSKTAKDYDAAGRNLMIKIELGVYDSDFLNTYQSDSALRKKSLGRIGIFLIPYDSTQIVKQGLKQVIKTNFAAAPPPPPPGGGTGYDIGGIYP